MLQEINAVPAQSNIRLCFMSSSSQSKPRVNLHPASRIRTPTVTACSYLDPASIHTPTVTVLSVTVCMDATRMPVGRVVTFALGIGRAAVNPSPTSALALAAWVCRALRCAKAPAELNDVEDEPSNRGLNLTAE